MKEIDISVLQHTVYDVVIVGAGVAGAIVAKELANAGHKVLVMEAGMGSDLTIEGYQDSLTRFYKQTVKNNNSPYIHNPNADSPQATDVKKYQPGGSNSNGYFLHNGPVSTDSTYLRSTGGSTMHWQACTPRMIPDDFRSQTKFGQGKDWPITYDQLEPYYRKAEFEMGVSGDAQEQDFHEIKFGPGYLYPMKKIPPSYLDQVVAKGVNGMKVEQDNETFTLKMRSTPQARNGVPNKEYDGGKGYQPSQVSSNHQVDFGQRCQGNANCTPICPVQAKYDARRTLLTIAKGDNVDFISQTVASQVEIDPGTGRVTGIHYKNYKDPKSSEYTEGKVTGKIFVLATNAIENPKLMLASGLTGSSKLMGKNLMDHVYFLTWALLPEPAGTMRGPHATSGIDDLRSGNFRKHRAAFRAEVQNLGWGWATGSPFTDLTELVDSKNMFGKELRKGLLNRISNQLLFSFMIDQLPEEANSVTIDPNYKDALGNYRPVLNYSISDYTMAGVAYAREFSKEVFERLGAQDYTQYNETDFGYLTYQGQGYSCMGGNHFSGTHIMGTSKNNSVVDARQRSWDHENLYLVGSGSSVSINTSNPTLTLAAVCFMTTESIIKDLQ
jgi:choline dehydrogenase-like flavoprotein